MKQKVLIYGINVMWQNRSSSIILVPVGTFIITLFIKMIPEEHLLGGTSIRSPYVICKAGNEESSRQCCWSYDAEIITFKNSIGNSTNDRAFLQLFIVWDYGWIVKNVKIDLFLSWTYMNLSRLVRTGNLSTSSFKTSC